MDGQMEREGDRRKKTTLDGRLDGQKGMMNERASHGARAGERRQQEKKRKHAKKKEAEWGEK